MALISCPECSKVVSDQAFFCPNCGYPLQPQLKNALVKVTRTFTDIAKNIFSFLFTTVLLILAIGLLMYVSIKAFDYLSKNYLR